MNHVWITLDTPVAEVGETLTGHVQWEGFEKEPRAVEVTLGYRTSGRGDVDTGTVATSRAPAGVSGVHRFELVVPPGGPITFDGRLIRLSWHVAAKLDLAWADDPEVIEDVVVFPKGGRTLWVQRTAPPPPPPPPPPAPPAP